MSVILDEYSYLIHLINCALRDQQPQEIPDQLSFETVYEYGVLHEVANIAFHSLKKLEKKPVAELYSEWEECCDMAVIRDINQAYAREEILCGFRQANIRSLEIQGTAIKKLYPQPEYRTMSDIDFIIDLKNLLKARGVLRNLDYQCEDVDGVEVDGFRPPNIHIEIHTEYFPEHSDYHNVMRPPFTSVDETGEYDINDFYIYNMLHIAKHYYNKGCGIRRVLDVYYLNHTYGKLIDKAYVQSVFKAANVVDFVIRISSLANCWFGDGEYDNKTIGMEKYILNAGLHGNEANALNNRLRKVYGDGEFLYKLKYCMKRLLAGNETMCIHYPFLERWKVLYPFCWLHRAIRAMHPADKHRILEEVKVVIASDLKEKY